MSSPHDPQNTDPSYFRYWGKAAAAELPAPRCHLLPFHSLDVAACGRELLTLPRFGADAMVGEIGWSSETLRRVLTVFLAVHDIGKFSRGFQGLVKNLGEPLVPPLAVREKRRHDVMGWLFLEDCFYDGLLPGLHPGRAADEFWKSWFRLIAGHHGRPPQQEDLKVEHLFLRDDREAAKAFLAAVFALLHPDDLPAPGTGGARAMLRLSWRLAGIAVLADWIGSNAEWFPLQETPQTLSSYWESTALPQARDAVFAAGLEPSKARSWTVPRDLFDFPQLTPLQRYAATVPLANGPQLFLLEDVTGSGKTEAALLLAHRLMAAGHASGLYFGLPTTATANQLYGRVGDVYRKLYEPGENPSLVLSHRAAKLATQFRQNLLRDGRRPPERELAGRQGEPPTASAQCSTWLADSRKKAMLADVGVGTIDQALLGVLPVRHQSLRLLGLSRKVLIVDEVHVYDAYTSRLLGCLVQAHAMAGGSTVLLSATVPASLRRSLMEAFRRGLGTACALAIEDDPRYPLGTHAVADGTLTADAFATRPDLVRTVRVEAHTAETDALAFVVGMAEDGRAVCWIRNTVEDARRAYSAVRGAVPSSQVMLFHARYAMGDRLEIEQEVLRRFGKHSDAERRHGQVLVATQVAEQSLDLDFDEMLSDLAPIDLLIQRAGRLHRHVRDANGNKSTGEQIDGRGAPTLHLLAPEWTAAPEGNWYAALFPKGQYVYPDIGKLWLTLKSLLEVGKIVSPGMVGEAGSVRSLIEAVYDETAELPAGLQAASRKSEAKLLCERSLGAYNTLQLDQGYCDLAGEWDAAVDTPTRLGDETALVYLARAENDALVPLVDQEPSPWEMSSVSLRRKLLDGLAPGWQARFGAPIEALRKRVRLLSEQETLILPLVLDGDGWLGHGVAAGKPLTIRYTRESGLELEGNE